MPTKVFADFEIWIGAPVATSAGTDLVHPTRAFSSVAGTASSELKLPLDAPEFDQKLAIVRGIEPDLESRRLFGELLFRSLFQPDVLRLWDQTVGRVDERPGTGLRLRLWIDPTRLALLPWELLYEPGLREFLATVAGKVMSRYLPVPEPPILPAHKRLRALVVVESPPPLPQVTDDDVAQLQNAMETAGSVIEPPLVLRNPTVEQIQAALQQDFHVFHYLGHGRARKLILTGDDGKPKPINDQELAMLFRGRRTLRLVMLSACQSSQSESGGLFAGIGPALVGACIPAVVAMQYPFVQLDTARLFNTAFYHALANDVAVDAAVNEARQAIAAGLRAESPDWSTPVLYMGTRTGQLFNFESTEKTEVERAWQVLRAAAKDSEQTETAFSNLVKRFHQLADEQRRVRALAKLQRLLADVNLSMQPLDRIVARPNLQQYLAELTVAWNELSNTRLQPLWAFAAAHAELDVGGWLPHLQEAAKKVAYDVDIQALALLHTSIKAFVGAIAYSEALVREQSERALENLLAMSDRTLGVIPGG